MFVVAAGLESLLIRFAHPGLQPATRKPGIPAEVLGWSVLPPRRAGESLDADTRPRLPGPTAFYLFAGYIQFQAAVACATFFGVVRSHRLRLACAFGRDPLRGYATVHQHCPNRFGAGKG